MLLFFSFFFLFCLCRVIGEVAFTGKHRWMLSDAAVGDRNSICSIVSQDAFQVLHQLLLGKLLVHLFLSNYQ